MLANYDDLGRLLIRGNPILEKLRDHITSATVDMGVSMVTEVAFTIEDPGFTILQRNWFDLNTPVTYRGLDLVVAVLETDAGGGQGGFTVRCRPTAVSKLKKLRGPRVVKDISPSAFVKSECALVNVKAVVQPGNTRPRIAREVVQKGQEYDETNHPSAWTTFQSLANQFGYIMYEVGGTIYFAKPTWLVQRNPKPIVNWYPINGTEPLDVPQFRHSIDNSDVELNLTLPLDRVGSVFPGYGIIVSGYPKFSGTYFINQVNYPLYGNGTMSVSASTIKNPKAQKAAEQNE